MVNAQMTIPKVHSFGHLIERAKSKASTTRPKAALVVPSSPEWLQVFDRAIREQLIDPVIIGDEALFNKMSAECNVTLDGVSVIDINQPDTAIATAARMAAQGEIDMIVKGCGPTADFLKALMKPESSFAAKSKTISYVGVIKPKRYRKMLLLTDAGVLPQPDLKTKVDLIGNIVSLAGALGIDNPRIAVLAAVEAIYPQMPVTTEAAVLAKMSDRGQIKGGIVDGPLSFDCAVDVVAAQAKGITTSEVAGQADAMIAPNIETADGVYKAMTLYGEAEVGGILVGGRAPVALANRWDSSSTRYNSIVLAVLAS